jgi:hypothetical protein
MKIMVAIPSHDHVPINFAYDLAQMMAFTAANMPEEASVALTLCSGTYVHSARNDLAKMAVEGGSDFVLWLDSDMRFPKDTLFRLMFHNKDMVGINYSHRKIPPRFVAIKSIKPPVRLVTGPDSTGLEDVAAIGFGAVLMRGSMLRKMAEQATGPLFWFTINEDGGMVGEDVHFCLLARDAGFEVFVDHDLSKECSHIGSFEYRVEHAEALLEEEAAEA